MEQIDTTRSCPTCGSDETRTQFYGSSREKECKGCKRMRSRRNRREQARRLVLAERLIDVLASLAERPTDEKAS